MKYDLSLIISDDVYDLLKAETHKADRSSTEIIKKKRVVCKIQAKDAVALKAQINSVIKTLTVFEKCQKQKKK